MEQVACLVNTGIIKIEQEKDVNENIVDKLFKCQENKKEAVKCELVNLPPEIIKSRHEKQIKEDFRKEVLDSCGKKNRILISFIIALVGSIILDLFYWLLFVTPHKNLMSILGPFCITMEIISVIGIIITCGIIFISSKKIEDKYNRLLGNITIDELFAKEFE